MLPQSTTFIFAGSFGRNTAGSSRRSSLMNNFLLTEKSIGKTIFYVNDKQAHDKQDPKCVWKTGRGDNLSPPFWTTSLYAADFLTHVNKEVVLFVDNLSTFNNTKLHSSHCRQFTRCCEAGYNGRNSNCQADVAILLRLINFVRNAVTSALSVAVF